MNAYTPKRRGRGEWILDWRDIGERALRAVIVIGWFGFVGTLLAMAVAGAR